MGLGFFYRLFRKKEVKVVPVRKKSLSERALELKLNKYGLSWEVMNQGFKRNSSYKQARASQDLDLGNFPAIFDECPSLARYLLRGITEVERGEDFRTYVDAEKGTVRTEMAQQARIEQILMIDYKFRLGAAAHTRSHMQFGSYGCIGA